MKKSIIIGATALLLALPTTGFASDASSTSQPAKIIEESNTVAAATGRYVSGIVANVSHRADLLPKTYFHVDGTWAGTLTLTGSRSNGNGNFYGIYAGYLYNGGIQ